MPSTSSIWPAVWSAVAASCSALTSIILLVVHYRNRVDSVRPEIFLEDWSFEKNPDHKVPALICIKKIRNEGRGSASYIQGQLKVSRKQFIDPGLAVAGLGNAYIIQLLSPGKELEIDWQGHILQWKGIATTDILPLDLSISMLDLHGRRYETIYELNAIKEQYNFGGPVPLAPDLWLMRRYTVVMSMRRFRLSLRKRRLLSKIQRIDKFFCRIRIFTMILFLIIVCLFLIGCRTPSTEGVV